MKLKKITLENIRSYEREEIEFPEGSTLLSGDIGSGKTSILLGIEFALFGLQPGQKGNAILRNGKDKGSVALEFEVEGQSIIIERSLKRSKKSITQDYCAITIDEVKQEFSVTELKDKVLEILSYPKEFSRKQNILYKFTVYTPQEEMKQIITQDSETRVNTLRHVFGIDRYKRILENASILSSIIREEKRFNEAKLEGFESDRELLASREDELEAKYHNLSSVEKELFLKTEQRKKVEEEKLEISGKIEEKSRFQQEMEKAKIILSGKNQALKDNEKTIGKINSQISEAKTFAFSESRVSALEQEISLLKKEIKSSESQKIELSGKISSLKMKNSENESVKEKLSKIEICPTCLQDVNPVYKSNVSNKLDFEVSKNANEIRAILLELESLDKKTLSIESKIAERQKEINDLVILKVRLEEVREKQSRVRDLETLNLSLGQDIRLLEQQIQTLSESIFNLKKFEALFEAKQLELNSAFKEEKLAEIKVAELKKEIEVFSRQIEDLKARIKASEKIKEKLDYLIKVETWLSKDFTPLVSLIEKNVMIKLKSEFSEFFSRWFSMLVSDTFNVRLDDNFAPIIEYQDYELDYEYMSGGERTAVALAYRLALNQVVNSLLSKIKTRSLVILDEPTDGFSEQQLDKMRDVLSQLDVGQLIIVSHEQKIESFVENVIRLGKDQGVSRIAQGMFA